MGCHLFAELVKWTIPLMFSGQIVDYKVKFNIKECSIKFSNLMSLTLYDDKDSVANNSPHGDKSDYHTSSDTITYEPQLVDENIQPYSQILKLMKL